MSKIFGTLVRGEDYFLGGKHFKKGVPVEVTADEKRHLEENARDPYDSQGQDGEAITEWKPKFDFKATKGDAPAPRQRQRPTGAAPAE